MKLQIKINYRFLILLLGIFISAGVALFLALGYVVNENLDEVLNHRKKDIHKTLQLHPSIESISDSLDKTIEIEPTPKAFKKIKSDTLMYDLHEKERVNFRKLVYVEKIGNVYYRISLISSKLEREDLVEMIFYFMLGLFTLIVLVLFFLNRWLSNSIWKPFYKIIALLESFNIGQKTEIKFPISDIYEFEQLSKSLKIMMQKAQSDFNNLKEFTENASHEIQTPMAVIQSKLESVLQDKNLTTKQYKQVQIAYESALHLSKLNEALLLLAKIENGQFPETKDINLCELIQERLEFIDELIAFKKIDIVLDIKQAYIVKLNPYLAEILINNLLGNAIKHNVDGGQIYISSKTQQFIISNTGNVLTIAPEKLFQRFTKHHTDSESTGLGLAIAFEICKKSGLDLQYKYQNGLHCLIIGFNS
ncbi:MAG: HAMP domain-containing sensor histidine kinase [Paludibacteraceae bacterium]|nr:HAMP domain-containing sensor histidine kinase [Paludibacteraceae bacterium]